MHSRILRAAPLALLLGAAGPQACVPGATRASARCNPGFPQGVKGPVRTVVLVLYTNELCGWDQSYRETAMDFHSNMIKDSLARAAAGNPDGPRYEFVPPGSAADLWLTFMVTGQTHLEEDYLDGGNHCVGKAWIHMEADGMRSNHLFGFDTHSYEFRSNAYGLGAYQEAADQASSFLNNGWTCN